MIGRSGCNPEPLPGAGPISERPSTPTSPSPASGPDPAPAPLHRRRWLLWSAGTLAALGLLVGLGVPWLLSSSLGRDQIVKVANSALHGEVSLDDFEFGWFRGVRLEGLVIREPAGFPPGEACSIQELTADLSIVALLGGAVSGKVRVVAPKLRAYRRADERINWQEILGLPTTTGGDTPREPGTPRPAPPPDTPADAELPRLKVDFELTDGEVEIHDEELGLIHALRRLNVSARSHEFEPPFDVEVTADLESPGGGPPGALKVNASVDPRDGGSADVALNTDRLDFAPYRVLLNGFGLEVDELEGVLQGHVTAKVTPDQSFHMDGELTADGVKVAMPAMGGSIRVPRMVLKPTLDGAPATGRVNDEAFVFDLAFLKITGMPEDRTRGLFGGDAEGWPIGFHVSLDVEQFRELSTILPESLDQLAGLLSFDIGARNDNGKGLLGLTDGPLEFVVQGDGKAIQLGTSLIPESVNFPKGFQLQLSGQYDAGQGTLTIPGLRFDLGKTTAQLGLNLGPDQCDAHLDLDLQPALVKQFLQAYASEDLDSQGATTVTAKLRSPWPLPEGELGALFDALDLSGALKLANLRYDDNQLTDGEVQFQVGGGALSLTVPETTRLNGGGLRIATTYRPDATEHDPVTVQLDWQGGGAGGSLAPVLGYAMPLLAGLKGNATDGGDLKATVALGLEVGGPLDKGENESWLELLGRWGGGGKVALSDGALTPASGFQELSTLLGDRKLDFSRWATDFRLENGGLTIPGLDLGERLPLKIRGRTALDGTLDYQVDLGPLLQKLARDRGNLAGLLGGGDLTAHLGGSVSSPELALGDLLGDTLKNAAGDLTDQLRKDPEGAVNRLKGLFDRGKKDKKDG